MDSDLTAALESVLSDPAKMEKVTAMAKDLFAQGGQSGQSGQDGQDAPPSEEPAARPDAPSAPPAGDMAFLSTLGKAFAGGGKSRSTALLMAMRPYMKPEKQAKLDRAMQIAKMANIAGLVMKEYGGGGHGV